MPGFASDGSVYAPNVDFTGSVSPQGQVLVDGQLLIGSSVFPNIRVGTLTSSDNSISWVFGHGTISGTVTSGTGVLKTLTGNIGGPISPTAGNINLLGSGALSFSGSGSTLTLSIASGGFSWTDVTAATQTIAAQNGYITDRGGGVTYTLPASGALGDQFIITGKTGLWTLAQNALQKVSLGYVTTTPGASGSVSATQVKDGIEIICVTSNIEFEIIDSIGNPTIV